MASYFMFNAISARRGYETERTLVRADMVEQLEYNVFDPRYALTRLMLKGDFARELNWSYFACCRNLPAQHSIQAARATTANPQDPAIVFSDVTGKKTRLAIYNGGAGVRFHTVEETTPSAYAKILTTQGHQIICFPRPSDYKARYGVA
jgi:hypothetical protein